MTHNPSLHSNLLRMVTTVGSGKSQSDGHNGHHMGKYNPTNDGAPSSSAAARSLITSRSWWVLRIVWVSLRSRRRMEERLLQSNAVEINSERIVIYKAQTQQSQLLMEEKKTWTKIIIKSCQIDLSITFILQVDLNFVFVGFYITMICHFLKKF